MEEKSKKMSKDKILSIHKIVIFAVCLIMGIVNLFTGYVTPGIIVVAAGILLPLFTSVFPKMKFDVKALLLSIGQTLVIIVISSSKGEVNAMFPLFVASVAMASTYLNTSIIKALAAVTNIAMIGALFMKDLFYIGAPLPQVILGIAGVDIGIALIYLMTKSSIGFIVDSDQKAEEATRLVGVVNQKMEESNEMSKQQEITFAEVKQLASGVNKSSVRLIDFSQRLSNGASEQTSSIEELKSEVDVINNELNQTLNASVDAGRLADESCAALRESTDDFKNMLKAMDDIASSSEQINDIIKTIDDIALQTNILALNASVEAARAGEAGKGFAVVAEEVRNLAKKSAEAAQSTSSLISNSITSINNGTKVAGKASKAIEGVISISENSAEKAKSIAEYAKNQNESMRIISDNVQQILDVVQQNARTAEESTQIAEFVAGEVAKINSAVTK